MFHIIIEEREDGLYYLGNEPARDCEEAARIGHALSDQGVPMKRVEYAGRTFLVAREPAYAIISLDTGEELTIPYPMNAEELLKFYDLRLRNRSERVHRVTVYDSSGRVLEEFSAGHTYMTKPNGRRYPLWLKRLSE